MKDYCWRIHNSTHGEIQKGFLMAKSWHEAKHFATEYSGLRKNEWQRKGKVWLMPISGTRYMTLELRC